MLFYNQLLIIRQLQPSVDFAVRDQQEIILRYRKENGGNALPKIGQNRHSLFLHARHSPIPSATVHVTSTTVHVSSATVHVSFADVPPPLKKNPHFILHLNSFSLSLPHILTREEAITAGIDVHEIQHSMKRRTPWHDYSRK